MVLDRPIRNIMQTDVRTISVEAPLSEVQELLDSHVFHHVPVVDGKRLVGILSTVDLARVSLEPWVADPATRSAWLDNTMALRDVMTALPEVLHPDEPIRKAAELLGNGHYHALPVVEDTELVGIVTSTDLIRLLYYEVR